MDSATHNKTAQFIIDFATFVGHATVREVVHAQCSLHCVTGIEGEYYNQHGVNIHPSSIVAAGMVVPQRAILEPDVREKCTKDVPWARE